MTMSDKPSYSQAPIIGNGGDLVDHPRNKNQISDAVLVSEIVWQLQGIGLLPNLKTSEIGAESIEWGKKLLADTMLWKTAIYELAHNEVELEGNWKVILETPTIISHLVKQQIIDLRSNAIDPNSNDAFELADHTRPFLEHLTEPIAKAGIIVNWWKDQLENATAPYKAKM